MKKLIWFIALMTISIIVPLLLRSQGEDTIHLIDHIAFIIAAVCGIITAIVAILLYDRYGIEAKKKEEQLNAIKEAITEFQKVHFVLIDLSLAVGSNPPTDQVIPLTFQTKKENVLHFLTPEALSSTLFYKQSGMYGSSQLTQRTQSIVYLPKPIAEAISKLSIFKYDTLPVSYETRPITVLSAFSDAINNGSDSLDAANAYVPEQKLSVIGFLDIYFGVKDAIIAWYQNNDIDTDELNLDFT